MEWSFKEGLPIYSQIAKQMKVKIAKGVYSPGEKVPSVRELAMEAGVNPNTMQKALAELERETLLHSERTSGRFVTEDEKVVMELKKSLSREFVKELFENLEKLGMTRSEIVDAVKQLAEEER